MVLKIKIWYYAEESIKFCVYFFFIIIIIIFF